MTNLKAEIEEKRKEKISLENELYLIKLNNTLQLLSKSIEELDLELFNSVDEDFKSLKNINILAEESESCNKDDVLEKLKRKDKEKLKKEKELLESLESKVSEQKIDNLNKNLSDIFNKILSIEKIIKSENFKKKFEKQHAIIEERYKAIQVSLSQKIKESHPFKGYKGEDKPSAIINNFFSQKLKYGKTDLSIKENKEPPPLALNEVIEKLLKLLPKQEKYDSFKQDLIDFNNHKTWWFSDKDQMKKIEAQYHDYREQYPKADTSILPPTEEELRKEIEEIYTWAQDIVKSQEKAAVTDQFLLDAVNMMDRAYRISTGKYRLKETQIIAFLAFTQLEDESIKGKLIQVLTGEGKTTIVSLVAVFMALTGKKVDIITSNSVLAKEGVRDKEIFYNLFGLNCTHNTDLHSLASGKDNPYTADILYGTISSFHFDYLKHYFKLENIRADRGFDAIILDEVDNILVDNGSHSTRISEPTPGLDSLRYHYLSIWIALESVLKTQEQERVKQYTKYAEHNHYPQKDQEYYGFLDELIKQTKCFYDNYIKDKEIPQPSFLKEYVEKQQKETWIKNAIVALFHYHEDKHYIITEEKGYKCIVPIDSCNTGITLSNTILSEGIHQFLQIKHQLHLTVENLESNYISNICYVDLYHNIFGLTGTLGSEHEQKLLSNIYPGLDYVKIPPSKEKQFKTITSEQYCITKNEDIWIKQIIARILEITKLDQEKKGQPVLAVFEFIEEAKLVYELLSKLDCDDIRLYINEETSDIVEPELNPGTIVIATNIAGRGTDFQTSTGVEEVGGLHVCLTFLPCNKRVEEQAFGRTSRNGKKGSGEFIINQETLNENMQKIINKYFPEKEFIILKEEEKKRLNEQRDELEKQRIQNVIENQLCKILVEHNKFQSFCSKMPALYAKYPKHVLKDIEMRFAFSLKEALKKDALFDVNNYLSSIAKVDEYNFFNPYYAINYADYLIEKGEEQKAIDILNSIIENPLDSKILYAAHLKLFEAELQKFSGTWNTLNKIPVIGKIMGKILQILGISKTSDNCKGKVKKFLEDAKNAILAEVSIIESFDEKNILLTEEQEATPLFDSIFLKKNFLEEVYLENIISLLDSIKSFDENDFYLSFADKVKNIQDVNLHDIVNSLQIKEIESLGLNKIYALEQCKNVKQIADENEDAIEIMALDLEIAISLLGIGIVFPLSGLGAFAVNRIVDVFMDFIMLIVFEQASSNKLIDKLKDYGFAILSFGINKLLKCQKFLNKALKVTQKITEKLKNSKYFKTLCTALAKITTKVSSKLQTLIESAKAVEKGASLRSVAKNRLKDRINTDIIQGQFKGEFLKWLVDNVEEKLKQEIKQLIEINLPPETEQCNQFIQEFQNKFNEVTEIIKSNLTGTLGINFEETNKKRIYFSQLISGIPEFYEMLKDTANEVIFEITRGYRIIIQLYTQIKTFFTQHCFGEILKLIRDFFEKNKSFLDQANVLQELWNKLSSVFNSMVTQIKQIISSVQNVLDFFQGGISKVIEKIYDNIREKLDSAKSKFNNLILKAKSIFNDFKTEDIQPVIILYFIEYLVAKIKDLVFKNNPIVKYLNNKFGVKEVVKLFEGKIKIKGFIADNIAKLLIEIIKKGLHYAKKLIKEETGNALTPVTIEGLSNDCTFKALAVFFGFNAQEISTNFNEICCKISNETGFFLGSNGASAEEVKCIIEILLDKQKNMELQQSEWVDSPFTEKPKQFLLKYNSETGEPAEGIGFFKGSTNHAMNITSEIEPYIKQYDKGQIVPIGIAALKKYQKSAFITVTPYFSSRNAGYNRIKNNKGESAYLQAVVTGEQGGELFGTTNMLELSIYKQEERFINNIFNKKYIQTIEIFSRVNKSLKCISIVIKEKKTVNTNTLILEIQESVDNSIKALYSPYIGAANNGTYQGLKETFVKLEKSNVTRYACSGFFEGCSLILIIASDWIGMLHDAAPLKNIEDKYKDIAIEHGDIKLIRVDEETNSSKVKKIKGPFPIEYSTYPETIMHSSSGPVGQRTMFFLRDCMDNTRCQLATCTGITDPHNKTPMIKFSVNKIQIQDIDYYKTPSSSPRFAIS